MKLVFEDIKDKSSAKIITIGKNPETALQSATIM